MMDQERFHQRVEEIERDARVSPIAAIQQAAWEQDHPGMNFRDWLDSLDKPLSPLEDQHEPQTVGELLSQQTVAGGRCSLCERDADELLPWASQRLCWDCVDIQLDLLAKAVQEAGAVPVLMEVA